MKILYITSDPLEYSSSANMRNIALIQGLIENGHNVNTLSTQPDNESIYVDNSKLDLKLEKRYWIEDKLIIKINKKNNNKKRIKKKMKELLYKLYVKFSIYDPKKRLINNIKKIKFTENYDLIISSSDPKSVHLLAEKVLEYNPSIAKEWIQYWGDPFACDINSKKWMPKYFIKKEEQRIITKADKVIYVSPFTLKQQKELYPSSANKMKFVPIAYKKCKIYEETNNEKYSISYFGDYNERDRNIMPLYEAIKENEKYKLLICGNSNLNLTEKENIQIFSRQSRATIEQYETNTDLLVCICNKKGKQIPGKVYHYAATNKAILIILDGNEKEELKMYFDKFKRYYMCNNNKKEIIETIEKIKKEERKFVPLEMVSASNIAKKIIEM